MSRFWLCIVVLFSLQREKWFASNENGLQHQFILTIMIIIITCNLITWICFACGSIPFWLRNGILRFDGRRLLQPIRLPINLLYIKLWLLKNDNRMNNHDYHVIIYWIIEYSHMDLLVWLTSEWAVLLSTFISLSSESNSADDVIVSQIHFQ